jgi:hypothetical protein
VAIDGHDGARESTLAKRIAIDDLARRLQGDSVGLVTCGCRKLVRAS